MKSKLTFIACLLALGSLAFGQTTTLTENDSTGLVNTSTGVTPNFATIKIGGTQLTLPASTDLLNYTAPGTGGVAVTVTSFLSAGEATPEMYGGSSASGFDNATAFGKARDAGMNLVLPAGKTYELHSAVSWPKYNGQYIRGLNPRSSIVSVTTDTDGLDIVAASVNDPHYGAGVFHVAFRNFTLKGPGSFNSGTGAFSGSTGDGLHFENGSSTYFGDYEVLADLHIEGFLRAARFNGIGNSTLYNCAFEYCGTGLSIGDTTGNSFSSVNLVTSNCATANIAIAGGAGCNWGLGDTNSNAAGSGTPLVITGGSHNIFGGNFEGCSPSGNVANISQSSVVFTRSFFNKGSYTDNVAVVVGTNGAIDFSNIGSTFSTLYTPGAHGVTVHGAGVATTLGAPPSGGGYRFVGSSGQYDLSLDWERYAVGDWSLNIGASSNGNPTKNLLYVDGVNNQTTIGHNAASQPTGTATLKVEGTFNATGNATLGGNATVTGGVLHLTPIARPGSAVEGDVYNDSGDHHTYEWNGTAWKQLDN